MEGRRRSLGAAAGLAVVLASVPGIGAAPPRSSPGSEEVAAALRDRAVEEGTGAFDLVRSLIVAAGPRLAGSPGDRAAVAWALRTLAELGFENVRSEAVPVPRWERGQEEGAITAPSYHPVTLAALGGSVGTPERGIEAEVVGIPSLAALSGLGADEIRGKVLYIGDRMERTRTGEGYLEAVRKRSSGPSEAGRKGAAALLIRSVGTSSDRFAHTGSTRYDPEVPAVPVAALSNPDADVLEALLASGEPVRFRLRLGARRLPGSGSANVLGEIPGRELPGEIVLLACHLDSWDLGHGAVDDGAGCGIVIEAGRRIAELPRRPRRTVRVVLFANEEFGLSGAKAYAEEHGGELERHAIAAEADFGAGRAWALESRVGEEALPAMAEVAEILAPLGIEQGGNRAHGGADLSPLRRRGVPVVGIRQDASRYFDVHHTANDTLAQIDPRALDQNVAAYAAFAYLVAEMEGSFGRLPPEPEEGEE